MHVQALIFAVPDVPVDSVLWSNGSFGTPGNGGSTLEYGMYFEVTSSLVITQLARWVISGNSQSHTLYIRDYFGGTIRATCSVNCSGATAGAYLWGAITPYTVTAAGSPYLILSTETNGGDQWYDDGTTSTPVAGTLNTSQSGYWSGSGHGGSSLRSFVPVNAKYH